MYVKESLPDNSAPSKLMGFLLHSVTMLCLSCNSQFTGKLWQWSCTWQEVICGARALSGSVSLIWLSPTTYYCIKDAKELFPSHRWVILYDCSLCWWVGATPTDWLTTADDGALVGSFSVRKVTEINANTFFVNSRMVNKWMGAFCWSIVVAFVGPQQQSCSLNEVCEKKGELWGWSNVCR